MFPPTKYHTPRIFHPAKATRKSFRSPSYCYAGHPQTAARPWPRSLELRSRRQPPVTSNYPLCNSLEAGFAMRKMERPTFRRQRAFAVAARPICRVKQSTTPTVKLSSCRSRIGPLRSPRQHDRGSLGMSRRTNSCENAEISGLTSFGRVTPTFPNDATPPFRAPPWPTVSAHTPRSAASTMALHSAAKHLGHFHQIRRPEGLRFR